MSFLVIRWRGAEGDGMCVRIKDYRCAPLFLLFILLILLVLWEEDCVSSSWMCCVDWERRFRHGDEGSVFTWEVRETF